MSDTIPSSNSVGGSVTKAVKVAPKAPKSPVPASHSLPTETLLNATPAIAAIVDNQGESMTLEAAFTQWKEAFNALIGALERYIPEVRETGAKLLGSRWSSAIEGLSAVKRAVASTEVPSSDSSLVTLMNVADSFEAVARSLETVSQTILDANVRAAVATGMSRTYSDNIEIVARVSYETLAAIRRCQKDTLDAASSMGENPRGALTAENVAAMYTGPASEPSSDRIHSRGGIATEMYVSVLLCMRTASAIDLLEVAKSAALGQSADDATAAEIDTEKLSGYHPIQAMCYTATNITMFSEQAEVSPSNEQVLQLALPRARLSVTYDMGPLVDSGRARAFGPVAAMTSGLNYKLIERLRTIRAAPIPGTSKEGTQRIRPPAIVKGPLLASVSPASTGRATMSVAAVATDEMWAPLAGARPRIAAYTDAASAIILDRLHADRTPGQESTASRYEMAIENETISAGETHHDRVVDVLVTEFARVYDAAPPASLQDLRDIAVTEEFTSSSYICSATTKLTGEALSDRLRTMLLHAGEVRVSYDVFEREARITQAIVAMNLARTLWRQIKALYWMDDESFSLSAIQRREVHLKHFRGTAKKAVEAASPISCNPPTLKLYAAADGLA